MVENNVITLVAVAIAMGVGVRWGVIGLCVAWVVGYVPTFVVIARRTLAPLQTPAARSPGRSRSPWRRRSRWPPGWRARGPSPAMALPVPIELAVLMLFGAGMYGALVLAFRPRTLRTFWVAGHGVMRP